jgi:alpha-L-fucosidase 2
MNLSYGFNTGSACRRLCLFVLLFSRAIGDALAQPMEAQPLHFQQIPKRWDAALPMGNGILGALLWEKNGALRLSLDRADLWDLRPMRGLDRPEFSYQWVAQQVAKGEYEVVQRFFDAPYEQEAGPSKLPGAALEWSLPAYKKADAQLDLHTGLSTITLDNGLIFSTFVHADERTGWFKISGPGAQAPTLAPPAYGGDPNQPAGGSVAGDDLARLGYTPTLPQQGKNSWIYHQPCYQGFSYEVATAWKRNADGSIEGVWSISAHFKEKPHLERASALVKRLLPKGFNKALRESAAWWRQYWAASQVQVPDSLIQRQYALDMYKFGCLARNNAPMISLQGIWTADNGRLPPWKGDFHHDLNTQLSYWPAYTANHLNEAMGYLKHLESNEAAHRRFTKQYFGNDGLNVPGVETLLGEPMGGWIQYSCSPTTAAWLAQHFYLQWRYSMDRNFLKRHAWPFVEAVAKHLEAITVVQEDGRRVLPLSSSPEIHNNSIEAWFPKKWSNYDLAQCRFLFGIAAEMANELDDSPGAGKWLSRMRQLPAYALDADDALMFAPDLPYRESHRHFSHLMAIHPLGLIDWEMGPEYQQLIDASLAQLEKYGPGQWTGYSYAWLGNLYARAHKADKAREALFRFADGFVSPNSFHVNGDQSGKNYSSFTYDPFTLEGNFAFAAGVQEMLLQSHAGFIDVFPAVPASWQQISFRSLRAQGAFLVSAVRKNGQLQSVEVASEKNAELQIRLPVHISKKLDKTWAPVPGKKAVWSRQMRAGERIRLLE